MTLHKILTAALLATTSIASSAMAETVIVSGNARVAKDFIVERFQPDKVSPDDLDRALKDLYASGQFENVAIKRSGSTVTVNVTEAPIVSFIGYNGNKRLKTDQLNLVLKTQAGQPYTKASIDADIAAIQHAYEKIGRIDARITVQTRKTGNTIALVFAIDEGVKSGIDDIYFSGNTAVSAAQLRSIIRTKESGVLNSLLNKDVYDVDQSERDRDTIRDYYVSKGFADVTVSDPEVTYKPDEHTTSIGYAIEEGPQYKVNTITVDSTVPEYANTVITERYKSSRVYDPKALSKLGDTIDEQAAAMTTAPVAVNLRTSRLPGGRMDVVYDLDKTQPVYIQRIDIVGNDFTKDYTIRRELDFSEGDRVNPAEIKVAERRLKALGFFKNVEIRTRRGIADDRVIMTIAVDEQKTGEFSVGAGYSSSDGVEATVGISQKNFMGTGRGLSASVGRGVDTSTYDIGFTEPHLMGSRASGFMDLYRHELSKQDDNIHPFREVTDGGKIGIKAPLSEDLSASIYYNGFQRQLSDVPSRLRGAGILGDPNLVPPGKTFTSLVGYTFDFNSLDDNLLPSEGTVGSFDQQFAGLGGDAHFVKTEAKVRTYADLMDSNSLIGSLSGRAGNIFSLSDDLAFADQLRNDDQLVRGFQRGGIGPRDAATNYSLGGQFYAAVSAETTAPLPFVPENYGFRGALFADAGSVWNADKATVSHSGAILTDDSFAVRASIGTGVIWNSPIGLIRANLALPVLKEDGDRTQVFSFAAGTHF